MINKKGQIGLTQIIVGFIVLVIASILILSLISYSGGGTSNIGDAIEEGYMQFSDLFLRIAGPLFTALLGLGEDSGINFLMILTFILVSIIIVSTLDTVNMFGDDPKKAGLINLAIGIIVSIIGVRFMPPDMWLSLTSPSSAFVATLLVGIPFFALFFVTMKIKFPLARKGLWLFYLIFMSYLIFYPVAGTRSQIGGGLNDFAWIYIIFFGLGIMMLIAEAIIRKFIFKESGKSALIRSLGIDYTKRLADIKAEISDLIAKEAAITGTTSHDESLKKNITGEIERLKDEYKEISGKLYTG